MVWRPQPVLFDTIILVITPMSQSDFSFRELWKMGTYRMFPTEAHAEAQVVNMPRTSSGRVTKPVLYFSQEKYTKGSGAAPRRGYDATDPQY